MSQSDRKQAEAALQESEERFAAFMNHLPGAAWIKDLSGRYVYANPEAQRIFSRSLPALLGKTDEEVFPPETARQFRENDHRALAEGGSLQTTEVLHQADGLDHYSMVNKFVLPGPGGQAAFIAGVAFDVTERKRAEEAVRKSEEELREREQRLRLALETAALGSYERDLLTNTVHLDENCRAILGVPAGRVDPEVARKSLLPEDVGWVLTVVARAYDPARREICAGEFRIRRPDGTIRWVAARGRVVFDDTVTPPRGVKFLGVLHDITERKLAEQMLQNQNRRLSLLSQATAKLLLAEHPEQILADVAEQLPECLLVDGILELGVSENGRELHVQGCWGIGRELQEHELSSLKFGQGLSGTVAQERKPLILAPVQVSAHPEAGLLKPLGVKAYACYPLSVGDRLLGTIAFASRRRERFEPRDLEFFETLAGHVALAQERGRLNQELRRHAETLQGTVEERTAKLQEMVGELEHFSYSITHDMRGPLRAMRGFAEFANLACEQDKPREAREYLQRIASSAERMDCLITDALHYSQSVRQELPLEEVDTGALLRGMLDTYPELQASRMHVQVQGKLPVVLGNQAGLTQCLSNLLGNALKFAKPGQVPQIRVWAEPARSAECGVRSESQDGSRAWVRIYVEDNGIGIAEELLPRVFDMFSRGNKKVEGTGIGLALVRKVTQRMGGRVGVESEEGVGSRFWLELRKSASEGARASGREGKDYETF
jgi:PAS domain S-box-containing protein